MSVVSVNLSAFFKVFKETLAAFSFNVGGLFAGFIVASQLGIFQYSTWAIAVYPAIVSAKGVIGGLLSGRLSTALHVGTIYPRFFNNTKSFYKLYAALIVITFATCIFMGLISAIFGALFWGASFVDAPSILLVILSTMTLGLLITLITTAVAFVTFKGGLDPDIVVYPIMSTTADIFITVCYAVVLNLFFIFNFGVYILLALALLFAIITLYVTFYNIHEKEFLNVVKEALLTVAIVSFIVNVTGSVLKRISEVVVESREIYTVYPAMIDDVGDVGSVVGSTTTTKLALGLLKPSFYTMKNNSIEIVSAWLSSAIYFVIFGGLSLLMNSMYSLPSFAYLISILLITNVIAVTMIVLVSYGVSIITFQKGLDPDNFVIPIESSLADSLTSIALLVALFLLG